jgi:hypothetical protein
MPVVDNKKLLKDGLVKYINDKFKDKYLQFIDVEMRNVDKNWVFISSCKNYTFSKCKTSDQLNTDKYDLYLQIVKYYNETGEWIDFKTVVKDYVLANIQNKNNYSIDNIMALIKEDIEKSENALNAEKPSLLAGVVKSVVGGSRRSKKRSASKTRKQKK